VTGRTGLDLGCGEGHNTRLLARRGARMTAIDITWRFLEAAVAEERREQLGIRYLRGSAVGLPFRDDAFDFVVAFMSLMDMAELDVVVAKVHRVLRPDGFLQFSIEHPCAVTPRSGWVTDEHGRRVARTIGGYFDQEPDVDTWLFSAAPKRSGAVGDRSRFLAIEFCTHRCADLRSCRSSVTVDRQVMCSSRPRCDAAHQHRSHASDRATRFH
jgi:ubiquinone/menaquinone biosynthesis C-methylase UbiE